jgi:glycogen(starch) synthase
MRVLLTTDTIGGVWTFTRELCEGLLSQGHPVALISFGHPPSAAQRIWVSNVAAEHRGHFTYTSSSAPLEWMPANENAYTQALPDLSRLVHSFRPDVIHASQFCFGSLPFGVPVVVTAHSDVLTWAHACEPEGLDDSAWLRQYRALVQRGLGHTSIVVAPTRWMLEALRCCFSLESPSRVVLNGRTLQQPASAGDRQMQAVSAGRFWDKAKNIDILVAVKTRVPIFVAGAAEHEQQHSIDESALTALAPLDEPDLLALFQSSSLYIAASRYEPFGLAPLEAALCGCAIVANDIASLREVWGEAAVYFRGAAALGEILDAFANDARQLAQAQARALRRAQQLTAGRMVGGYLDAYRTVTGELHPPCGDARTLEFGSQLDAR